MKLKDVDVSLSDCDSASEAEANNNNFQPSLPDSISVNSQSSKTHALAKLALELASEGDLARALVYLDACLDPGPPEEELNGSGIPPDPHPIDKLHLLEKRCLILLKLRKYEQVWESARRLLEESANPLAFKCLIVSLCKSNKLDQVSGVLKLWEKSCPGNLDMMSCRTQVLSLLGAVSHGLDGHSVFEGIEDALALSPDWLLGTRKAQDPRWKYRPVPSGLSGPTSASSNPNQFVLCLQYRFGHCSLGEKCTDAHGEQELEEWKSRLVLANLTSSLDSTKLDAGTAYLKSFQDPVISQILTAQVLGVSVHVNGPPLMATLVHHQQQEPRAERSKADSHSSNPDPVPITWDFSLSTPSYLPIKTIALIHDLHRMHFRISDAFFKGAKNRVNLRIPGSSGPKNTSENSQVLNTSVSSTALSLSGGLGPENRWNYSISIQFLPPGIFGTFRQRLIFDFGPVNSDSESSRRQILYRDIGVEVVPPESGRNSTVPPCFMSLSRASSESDQPSQDLGFHLRLRAPWTVSNSIILDSESGERVSTETSEFSVTAPVSNSTTATDKLTKLNYKDRMNYFLSCEQRARQSILSKYNVSARLKISDQYERSGGIGTVYGTNGHLFAEMESFRDISEDSAVGRLILRSCNTALLCSTAESLRSQKTKLLPLVYSVRIVDKAKNSIIFDLGPHSVETLGLAGSQAGERITVLEADVQFQLDLTPFTEQRSTLLRLHPTRHLPLLFPDFTSPVPIPWTPTQIFSTDQPGIRLNPKQKEAILAVTAGAGPAPQLEPLPPILLIGPFGTGKTFTIFQCIKHLLLQVEKESELGVDKDKGTRIMICTHSNSAADLYIKEYLDPMVESGHTSARPLRIYYTGRNLSTVHPTVLQYTLRENGQFRLPTRNEIMDHRVIVVTLSTSYSLISLDLPQDTFSHIFLDEAAQALESEAITPLLAAGPATRIVLAGDHMQLSPETFSADSKNFHASLLERLHCLYPETSPLKLMLCENYRSHSTIIQFASDSFYSAKLLCGRVQPVHDSLYPLAFYTARGEDVQDPTSTSYYNVAEVYEIVDRICWLVSSWPEKWGDWKSDSAIGVLTPYSDQVQHIRQKLRGRGLHSVSVERVLNVQGKQFRAVFLSTVRTSKPWVKILPPDTLGSEVDLGFLSNPKLLNTALTRAQSLVAVVGDPVSLCSLGKCRRLWEDFIKICATNHSLFGMSWTMIKEGMLGLELKGTYGFNPLAQEFSPETPVSFNSNSGTDGRQRTKASAPVPQPKSKAAAPAAPIGTFPLNPDAQPYHQHHPSYNVNGPPVSYYPVMHQHQHRMPAPQFHPHAQYYPTGPRVVVPVSVPLAYVGPMGGMNIMPPYRTQTSIPIPCPSPSPLSIHPYYYGQPQIQMGPPAPSSRFILNQSQPQGLQPSAFVEYCPSARNVPKRLPAPTPQQIPPIHSNTVFPPLVPVSSNQQPTAQSQGSTMQNQFQVPRSTSGTENSYQNQVQRNPLPQSYQNQTTRIPIAPAPDGFPNLNYQNQIPRNPPSPPNFQNLVPRNPPTPPNFQNQVPRNPQGQSRFFEPIQPQDSQISRSSESFVLPSQLPIHQIWNPPNQQTPKQSSPPIQPTQIFSPQEISYLQKLLSEQEADGGQGQGKQLLPTYHHQNDPALQVLRAKLAIANQAAAVSSHLNLPPNQPQEFSTQPSTLDPDWPYSRIWSNHGQISASAVSGFNNNLNNLPTSSSATTTFPIYNGRTSNSTPNPPTYNFLPPNYANTGISNSISTLSYAKVVKAACPAHPPTSDTSAPAHHFPSTYFGNQYQTSTPQNLPRLLEIPITRPTPIPLPMASTTSISNVNSDTSTTDMSTTTATAASAAPSKKKRNGKKGSKR